MRCACVPTLRNSRAVMKEMAKTTQAIRLGRAKGYFLKNLQWGCVRAARCETYKVLFTATRNAYSMLPNTLGYCSAGLAKKPPKAGPKTLPTDQTRGIREKALGWSSFSGTISATTVRMMPTAKVMLETKGD